MYFGQPLVLELRNQLGIYSVIAAIDNYVKIEKKLDIGKFYDVDITSAQEYDLIGKVAK